MSAKISSQVLVSLAWFRDMNLSNEIPFSHSLSFGVFDIRSKRTTYETSMKTLLQPKILLVWVLPEACIHDTDPVIDPLQWYRSAIGTPELAFRVLEGRRPPLSEP